MHVYNFQVLETHLDSFQHMNHATYLIIYEQARWELITKGGYSLERIHRDQMGPTVLEAKISYKRELKLHANIRIETKLEKWKGKTGMLHQKMLNEEGKICSELELLVGFFDMQKRKLIEAPQDWIDAIGASND